MPQRPPATAPPAAGQSPRRKACEAWGDEEYCCRAAVARRQPNRKATEHDGAHQH